jgi:hypothetical protein
MLTRFDAAETDVGERGASELGRADLAQDGSADLAVMFPRGDPELSHFEQ